MAQCQQQVNVTMLELPIAPSGEVHFQRIHSSLFHPSQWTGRPTRELHPGKRTVQKTHTKECSQGLCDQRKFTCVPLLEPPTRDRLSRFQAYKYLQTNKWVDCGQISLFSVAPGSSSNCSYGMIKIFTLMQNIEFWKVCGKITLLSTTCTHWSIDFVLTATVPELKQINRDM